MTDKTTFLEKLSAALKIRGISDVDIRPYLERFDRFYDRMMSDPERVDPEALSDVEAIADTIAEQISERDRDLVRLAERTMTIQTVPEEPAKEEPTDFDRTADIPAALPDPADPDLTSLEMDAMEDPTSEFFTDEIVHGPDSVPDEEMEGPRLPDYIEEEPAPNSRMFWILFAASLPLTIPLALAGLALFVILWGALAALIIGSVAALVAVAAGGTALSLVGIIYGVIQLFNSFPVGLYEIGLGVTVAGAVMFVGILLYNFAIRLMPWVIRQTARLLRYLIRRLRVLFNFLRRECAKL